MAENAQRYSRCMRKIVILTFVLTLFGSNNVYALDKANFISTKNTYLEDQMIKWTVPDIVKLPKSGCKSLKVKYKFKLAGPGALSGLVIFDNAGKMMGATNASVMFDGRSGSKQIQICKSEWTDGSDTFAKARKGTWDLISETQEVGGNGYAATYGVIKFR